MPFYLRWNPSIWAQRLCACDRSTDVNSRDRGNVFVMHVRVRNCLIYQIYRSIFWLRDWLLGDFSLFSPRLCFLAAVFPLGMVQPHSIGQPPWVELLNVSSHWPFY